MTFLPTTPGSIILESEPRLYPEDGSRYMGAVWQLQDDGKWLELRSDGKAGAVMSPNYFDKDARVLYEAPVDPKPYKELWELSARLKGALRDQARLKRDIDEMSLNVNRLQAICYGADS